MTTGLLRRVTEPGLLERAPQTFSLRKKKFGQKEIITSKKSRTCRDFFDDYDGLFFLLAGFDDWWDIEEKCKNDREDEWFDNVVADCVMEFGMGEDAAN